MQTVWEIFCAELCKTTHKHDLRVHQFVLMSNHFHLIASTPKANISQCMHQFMSNSSHQLNWQGNRINETFAGRHYKCILHEPNYYLNAYKYNYRNPVTAGICQNVEDYSFSSLQQIMGRARGDLILEEDTTFESDPLGTLKWLNTAPKKDVLEAVRFGLRRTYFKAKQGADRKQILTKDDRI